MKAPQYGQSLFAHSIPDMNGGGSTCIENKESINKYLRPNVIDCLLSSHSWEKSILQAPKVEEHISLKGVIRGHLSTGYFQWKKLYLGLLTAPRKLMLPVSIIKYGTCSTARTEKLQVPASPFFPSARKLHYICCWITPAKWISISEHHFVLFFLFF